MVLPILPIYATRRFGMEPETVTLLNAVFFGAQFLAGPFIGRLSDRYGRIPVLLVSQIGTVFSFIMLGLAQSTEMLFFARTLDGITGGNIIVAQAYVTDITPKEQRTQALGYIFAAFGVGFIFGPALGGAMAGAFSYETPYLVAAFAAAVVVFLTWRMLDETVTAEKRKNDQDASEAKMRVTDVLRNMPLISILLIAFGSQFAFAVLQSTFSLFGEAVLFVDNPDQVETGVGMLLAVVGVGQIITQLYLVKRLVRRFGEGSLVVFGSIVRALSYIVLVAIASIFASGVSLFLFAVGTGLTMPALQSLVTNTVPDRQRGGVLGLYQSAISLSIITGSAVAGTLFAITPQFPYVVGAIIFLVMTIPGYFLMLWARRTGASSVVQPITESPVIAPAGD